MPAAPNDARPGTRERDSQFSALALPLLPVITRFARVLAGNDADADDLVQETFLRAFRYWHTFDQRTDCRRWLMAICRNALYDSRRREAHVMAVEDDELETWGAIHAHQSAVASGVGDLFTRLDVGPAIARAVAGLAEPFRAVVVLSDVEGYSYEEIAVALDVPIGTVRSRLYRARRQLQEALVVFARDAGLTPRTTPLPAESR